MLPKINRLTQKKDFDAVFKKGKSLKGDFLICKVLKNTSNKIRIGFVVSKKISTKATVRNAVKRRLRAAALDKLKDSKISSADIVIIALPGAQHMEFVKIQNAMDAFSKK